MPRFRNSATGVVVSVSEEAAGLLGSDYVPADEPKKSPRKPAKRASEGDTDDK